MSQIKRVCLQSGEEYSLNLKSFQNARFSGDSDWDVRRSEEAAERRENGWATLVLWGPGAVNIILPLDDCVAIVERHYQLKCKHSEE
jgi:hypothetical protein